MRVLTCPASGFSSSVWEMEPKYIPLHTQKLQSRSSPCVISPPLCLTHLSVLLLLLAKYWTSPLLSTFTSASCYLLIVCCTILHNLLPDLPEGSLATSPYPPVQVNCLEPSFWNINMISFCSDYYISDFQESFTNIPWDGELCILKRVQLRKRCCTQITAQGSKR